MSSLPETASARTEVAGVRTRNYANFEIWGMKLPLPPWAIYIVGVLVVLGSGTSAYVKFLQPMFKEQADVRLGQYQEYQKHVFEAPEHSQSFFDSAELGLLIVKVYGSDGCLQVLRRNPGRNQAVMAHWIPAKSIEAEKPPGTVGGETNASLFQPPLGDHPLLTAQLLPASFKAEEPPKEEPVAQGCVGRCLNPHHGAFQAWNGEQRGCWIAVWRKWPEGCQHFQWFNSCNGYWDSDPTGAPRVNWTCCVH